VWLPTSADSMNLGESTLDNVIEPETIASTGIRKAPHVNDEVIAELTRLSNERRENSPEFRQYLDELRRSEARLRDSLVPLEEKAFADRMLGDKPADDDPHVVFQRNAYNNEVLGIALDYAAYWDRHRNYFEGSVLLRNGQHREALAALSRAAAQAPNDSRVRLQLGRAHAFLGDWTKALEEAKRAGYSAIDAYAGQEAKLEAKGQGGASLAAGTRVQITHVNKEWIWAADVAKPDVKGWVKPAAILPLLDGE
jgi:tetratricopeptide (TPR) repeat protein